MSNHPHQLPPNTANGSVAPAAPVGFVDAVEVELNRSPTPAGDRVQITVVTPVGFVRAQLNPAAAVEVGEKLVMLGRGIIPG